MKTYTQRYFSRTLSAVALALTTFTVGTASAAVLKADFNNDGYEDLVVGSPLEDVGTIDNAGAISVLYGSASGMPRFPSRQWYQDSPGIAGASEVSDGFGIAIAVGDFNGDGYDDVAAGVNGEDINGVGPDGKGKSAGVANVIYGSRDGLQAQGNQMLSLATLDPGLAQAEALFGTTLTTGDFNGDGYTDLAVGIPFWDRGAVANTGAVAVFFGGSPGFADRRGTLIYQGQPRVPITSEKDDRFGDSLTAADFDRDGYTDLAIGIRAEDIGNAGDAGAVAVVYGAATSDGFHPSRSHILTDVGNGAAVAAGDYFGFALTTGDFNGDTYPDLAVGAPLEDAGAENAGAVTIIYGSRFGMTGGVRDYWPANRSGLPDKAEEGDGFGRSLAAADFNSDGYTDLAIGVPSDNQERTLQFDRSFTGQVTVLYGSQHGMTVTAASYWHQDQPNIESARGRGDFFGSTLSVGDFNHDHRADLVVGVPLEGEHNTGIVHIFYGTTAGLSAEPTLGRQLISEVLGSEEAEDQFGYALP